MIMLNKKLSLSLSFHCLRSRTVMPVLWSVVVSMAALSTAMTVPWSVVDSVAGAKVCPLLYTSVLPLTTYIIIYTYNRTCGFMCIGVISVSCTEIS